MLHVLPILRGRKQWITVLLDYLQYVQNTLPRMIHVNKEFYK